jgi:hypothetical protein
VQLESECYGVRSEQFEKPSLWHQRNLCMIASLLQPQYLKNFEVRGVMLDRGLTVVYRLLLLEVMNCFVFFGLVLEQNLRSEEL